MSTFQHAQEKTSQFSPLQRESVPEASYNAFFKIIDRLEALLDEEVALLKTASNIDLTDLTHRKRQGYLELNRLTRSFEGTIPSQDIIQRLASFRLKLDANGTALRLHLQAAQDVTAIIIRVMRDFESDGTYSRALLQRDFELS